MITHCGIAPTVGRAGQLDQAEEYCFLFFHVSLHPKSPGNFKHKNTKKAVGVGSWNKPKWVGALERKSSTSNAAGGSFKTGTTSADVTPSNSVDLRLAPQNEFFWTSLISQQTKCGQGRQALRIYREMQEAGVQPSSYTFVAALKACSSLQDLASAKQIHAEVIKYGLEGDMFVGTMLVDVYSKCRSLGDARHVFELMPHRDVVSWNAMILGYGQTGEGEEALYMYTRMQQEGVAPNHRTFVGALRACSCLATLAGDSAGDGTAVKNEYLDQVRAIHSQVVSSGSESDVYVGTMLVDVYAKCGSLVDARRVFENMPCRNVVSWNAMILGYAHVEDGREALRLYDRMRQEGAATDQRTFVGVLKACSILASLEGGIESDRTALKKQCLDEVRAIHSHLVRSGCESDMFVGTMLVDVYAKCGSLLDARSVFEKMPHRDVVSWNAMILGYAQMEESEEALRLHEWMQQEGVVPDDRTFVGILKACSSLAAPEGQNQGNGAAVTKLWLEKVRAVHLQIMRHGCGSDLFVSTMLVDVYAKCGSLVEARSAFEKMSYRDVVSWNAMILGYAQMEEGEEALQLYQRMQQEGVNRNERTFIGALKACSSLAGMKGGIGIDSVPVKKRWLDQVNAIHLDIVQSGSQSDLFVGTMLVDAYAKCGAMMAAQQVFDKMPHHDVVCWNHMILGYAQMEDGEKALQLYTKMQEGALLPNSHTFVAALKACGSLAVPEVGKQGDTTFAATSGLDLARAIHSDIVKSECESDVSVGTVLVEVYAKCGSLVDARSIFEEMPHRDVVSWNTMILGYTRMDNGKAALELYSRMQKEGVVANDRTYVAALNACGAVADLKKGKEIHDHVSKLGLVGVDLFIHSALIDMYGKCGSMESAQQVFDSLPTRDIVLWNALVAGYSRQGNSELVFDLLERIRQEGIQPNGRTLISVLNVCSHAGLVDKGLQYFETMARDFGITPTIEHYTSIIDLLGRAGQLYMAMEILKKMPFQPDGEVWRCLLGSCQKWRNVDLGRQAFEAAVRLDDKEAAAYVLMANIYTSAHMLEEAQQIQDLGVKAGARKKPGQSCWTDVSGVVHTFFVEDQRHLESQDIYAQLDDLLVKLNL